MELIYQMKETDQGKTIHQILKTELNISTRLLSKLIRNKQITLNQTLCNTQNISHKNDILAINFSMAEDNSNIYPTKMKLDIIYEDDWFLVVNKPYGMPIHPSRLHYQDSLSNGIRYYFDTIKLTKKIRPVNRLDLDTSGLVIFAKCDYVQECFIQQMQEKTFQKEYFCLVERIFRT